MNLNKIFKMPSSHPHGRPVTIMKFSDTGDVEVDYDELEGIFNHEEIQDRKIVIISLIGAFRGGKSYLLNYCLRFLYANYSSINKPKEGLPFFFHKKENWMGSKDDPLKGFSWRSGIDRDTVGINMWSDVFLHTIESTGEKIAIFIMDTQGLFDNNSSTTENSRIFALSSLIASAQVLNLANRIQEDHLQHLQFSTEYTQFTALNKKDSVEKPFQDLMFLVRDWNDVDEYAFGKAGGMEYLLKEVLTIDSQRQELFSVRESIMDSFEHFACYLLPHPGKTVAGSKNYDGRWSEMDDEFKDELQNLVECLLIPDNLVIKKINSENVSVMDMQQYIKDYFELFRLNHDPEVSSIYELTIERYMNNLIKTCIDVYKQAVYNNRDLLTEKSMETIHENCKKKALEKFDEMKKMGNSDHEKIFKVRLSEKIDKIYNEHKDQSESNERRIEDEMNDQIKQLEKEKLLRKEAEEEKELAQNMLRSLKEMLPEDDDQKEELKRQIKIAEERIKAAKAVIEKLNKKEAKNKSFRKYLVAAVGGAVVVGLKVLVKARPCSIM